MADTTGGQATAAANAGGRGSRAMRWFAGPPGWVLGLLGAGNLLLTCWAYAVPGGYFDLLLWGLLIWCGLGAALLGKALTAAITAAAVRADGGGTRPRRRSRWRWAVLPVLAAAAVALVWSGLPVRAGTQLAQPAVAAYAADPGAPEPERFGPYRVLSADHLDGGGARFLVEGAGLINLMGFAYVPEGAPARLGEDTYTPLGGPWYAWTRRF